jgi:CTP:molybdopterin cytidylyltransferase MocA
VAGVLLAAGAGSRFSAGNDNSEGAERPAHKLLADFRGRPLLAWALEAADRAGFNQLYVVAGAVDVTAVVHQVVGDRATVLPNPRWAEGQATSLAVAVRTATEDDHRAIVVGLADQPLVPTSAWRSVGASAGEIVTATFNGKRRPPVKFERSVWDDLPDTGDEGARTLFRLRPELVSELPCSGNPVDIDTLEDLQQWS